MAMIQQDHDIFHAFRAWECETLHIHITVYIYIYIWVNYHNSQTWIVRPGGHFPISKNHFSSTGLGRFSAYWAHLRGFDLEANYQIDERIQKYTREAKTGPPGGLQGARCSRDKQATWRFHVVLYI